MISCYIWKVLQEVSSLISRPEEETAKKDDDEHKAVTKDDEDEDDDDVTGDCKYRIISSSINLRLESICEY